MGAGSGGSRPLYTQIRVASTEYVTGSIHHLASYNAGFKVICSFGYTSRWCIIVVLSRFIVDILPTGESPLSLCDGSGV